MKIDSNVHVYEHLIGLTGRGEARALGGGRIRYSNGEEEQVQPAFMGDKGLRIETYIDSFMKPYNIDKAVLTHSPVYCPQNSYYADIAKTYPGKFIVSCVVDPFAAYKPDILDWLMAKGCYQLFDYDISMDHGWTGLQPALTPDCGEFEDIYAVAKAHNMAVAFYLGKPGQLGYRPDCLASAANAHKELRFVCSSLLNPEQADRLAPLARCDNVWFDVSRVFEYACCGEQALKFVEYAVACVGSQRVMWGSNTPASFVNNSLGEVDSYLHRSTKLTATDLDNLYGGTAAVCYGV